MVQDGDATDARRRCAHVDDLAPSPVSLWSSWAVSLGSSQRKAPVVGWLNAGISVTFFIGVVLNLAQAITGDGGWPTQQPWLAVRVFIGVLFIFFVLVRLSIWLGTKIARRRARRS